MPGDFIELQTPRELTDENLAIEPRYDNQDTWIQPSVTKAIDDLVCIQNLTNRSVSISKHQHLAQVYLAIASDKLDKSPKSVVKSCATTRRISAPVQKHSSTVTIDPDNQLTKSEKQAFQT